MKKIILFFISAIFLIAFFQGCTRKEPYIKVDFSGKYPDYYFYELAQDTWQCIDYYVAPETGFPYDSDTKPDYTNTTNIGLYLTSIIAAYELGFVERVQALEKIEKILSSLEKLENWNGFLNNWINVRGKTHASTGANYISDFNKLPASLIVVRQEFPEVYEECSRILDGMDWSIFYNPASGNCYGGYDIVNKKAFGYLGSLAADIRLASFFMVAAGGAPPEAWKKLNRQEIEQYGMNFYKPGWNWGGLFMQAMGGIFLDERKTEMGKSTADFAYVQMLYARGKNMPVWGWSSCYIPGNGYTEGGFLPTDVVTPHASALAVIYYPHKVAENLKRLEELGARRDFKINNESYSFGFCDAINIKTGKTTFNPTYLTSLDQTMLFLSLANYLKDGLIWKLFEKDPIVKKGKELLKDYFEVENDYLGVYARRDEAPLMIVTKVLPEIVPLLIIDNFNNAEGPNNLGGEIGLWKLDPDGAYEGCFPEKTSENRIGDTGFGLKLNYDVASKEPAVCAYSQFLEGADLRGHNSLSFYIKGDKIEGFTKRLKIELWDNNGVEIIYIVQGITDEWQKIIIPFDEFKGILSRWDSPNRLAFVFENQPAFYKNMGITNTKGVIYIDDLAFERIE